MLKFGRRHAKFALASEMAASGVRNGARSLSGLGAQQGCFVNVMPVRLRKSDVASFLTMCVVRAADSGEDVPKQAVVGLPTQSDRIRQWQCGQHCGSFSFVFGAGAQDVCAITLFKSPWPMRPSLSVLSSSHGQSKIVQIGYSSYSSERTNASVDSGDTQTIEQVWEEYFADPSQWWDNRGDKRNPRSPDFEHKVTRKSLWEGGRSTPAWVKANLKLLTLGRLQSHAGCGTRDSEGNREWRQTAQGGCGSMQVQSARTMTTSGAIAVMKNRLQRGISIDSCMVVQVLKRCLKQKDLVAVKQVQDCIRKGGMDQNAYVANNLLSALARCGRLQDARRAFDELVTKNIFSWNMMIGAYAKSGRGAEAYGLFLQMMKGGFKPSAVTYVSILNGYASAGALEWVKDVHRHAQEAGLELDVYVGNALVHMYAKSGSIVDARKVFDRMVERDVITWNIVIGAYAESGRGVEAYQLFLQMMKGGFKPNAVTYMSILNGRSRPCALEWVKDVHRHAREAGLESDMRVGSALVHMYAKSGSIADAQKVFDRMAERNVITWNILIGAYAESGRGVEAYRLFLQMIKGGIEPDAATYVSILNACASGGALEWVKDVHRHAHAAGLESDVYVGNALVHMYAKSGSIHDARQVFDKVENRDVITWNVMIGGLAQHGCGHDALDMFREMIADGVKPDKYSFVAVLSACSHAGLVNDGRRLFLTMLQDHGVKPDVVHYTCMVDLLGRAGHLEDAKLCIDNMPLEPDGTTWKALLGACRIHGNLELGKLAFEEVINLEPKDASAYVLLSNIYAAAGMREEESSVRIMMQERGIRKEPGCSWIGVDNKIHRFVVGDKSHPEAKEIYSVLKTLAEEIKAAGYIPDTRLVLQDIDEAEKELALCSHSEKLAIAYGILRTPSGEAIRVYKNLRVCSDCHTATKFISKVTGRDILARDATRFHHFKDGVCSCDDYW